MESRLGDTINRLKRHYFIGRTGETELFLRHLVDPTTARVLNINGLGGMGKSTLLDELRRLSTERHVPFIQLDSRDFIHAPASFIQRMADAADVSETVGSDSLSEEEFVRRINEKAQLNSLVLAIDNYEEMDDMDWWIREHFLVSLSNRILVILCGRKPLKGGWVNEPAWRSMVVTMNIEPFQPDECKTYLQRVAPEAQFDVSYLFTLTQGHPLTLSLLAGLSGTSSDSKENWLHPLHMAASRWLRELPDLYLRKLLEAASMVRFFDQDLLENVVGEMIDPAKFSQLTELSFVRLNKRGWCVHDLLRAAMVRDLQNRAPQTYKRYEERSITYLREALETSPHGELGAISLSEFLYALGSSQLRSTYFNDGNEQLHYAVPVNQGNLQEAVEHFHYLVYEAQDYYHEFTDPVTLDRHAMTRLINPERRVLASLDIEACVRFGEDCVWLIKNRDGSTAGSIIMLPINRDSLPFLQKALITRQYWGKMSSQQMREWETPSDQPAGWVIYHNDLWKDDSPSARDTLIGLIFSFLQKEKFFLTSSPSPYIQEMIRNLGFDQLPDSEHFDYGKQHPAQLHILDLRKGKRRHYALKLMQQAGIAVEEGERAVDNTITELSDLTIREREVAILTLSCRTIPEIAKQLYVSPVTVKKHLIRIYEKMGVEGKTGLVKKLTELGFGSPLK